MLGAAGHVPLVTYPSPGGSTGTGDADRAVVSRPQTDPGSAEIEKPRAASRAAGRGRTVVDKDEAVRKIAALKAIVQAMLYEIYWESCSESRRERFDLRLKDDDALAMAITNELDADELAHAFRWFDAVFACGREELTANPVTPHLHEDQRMRARVALLAHEEADHAHTLAVRAPDRPDVAPLSSDERVRLAEEALLGRIEIDVLHEQEGWSGFTTRAKADTEERLAHLPEPWRKHAAWALPELGARVRETLEQTRTQDSKRG